MSNSSGKATTRHQTVQRDQETQRDQPLTSVEVATNNPDPNEARLAGLEQATASILTQITALISRFPEHATPAPSQTPSEAPSSSLYKKDRSTRMPDVAAFLGDKTSYASWRWNMIIKLNANRDWYNTQEEQITYVTTRLGNEDTETGQPGPGHHVRDRCNDLAPYDVFLTRDGLLAFLDSLYLDKNEMIVACRDLHKLKMRNEDVFADFFAQWSRLSNKVQQGSTDKSRVNDLIPRLNNRLYEAFHNHGFEYTTVDQVRERLVKLDDVQRLIWSKPPTSSTKARTPAKTAPSGEHHSSAPSAGRSYTSTNQRSSTATPAPFSALSGPCFNCGETGHRIKECPHPRRSASATRQVNAIEQAEYSDESAIDSENV